MRYLKVLCVITIFVFLFQITACDLILEDYSSESSKSLSINVINGVYCNELGYALIFQPDTSSVITYKYGEDYLCEDNNWESISNDYSFKIDFNINSNESFGAFGRTNQYGDLLFLYRGDYESYPWTDNTPSAYFYRICENIDSLEVDSISTVVSSYLNGELSVVTRDFNIPTFSPNELPTVSPDRIEKVVDYIVADIQIVDGKLWATFLSSAGIYYDTVCGSIESDFSRFFANQVVLGDVIRFTWEKRDEVIYTDSLGNETVGYYVTSCSSYEIVGHYDIDSLCEKCGNHYVDVVSIGGDMIENELYSVSGIVSNITYQNNLISYMITTDTGEQFTVIDWRSSEYFEASMSEGMNVIAYGIYHRNGTYYPQFEVLFVL